MPQLRLDAAKYINIFFKCTIQSFWVYYIINLKKFYPFFILNHFQMYNSMEIKYVKRHTAITTSNRTTLASPQGETSYPH